MLRHVHLLFLSADHTPTTLIGSCGTDPGITCRLVWDISHNGQAAEVTNNFLNGPVDLLLRVAFVIALAFVIRAVMYRVINRLTERAAAESILPQFKNGVANARSVPSRRAARRRSNGEGLSDTVDEVAPGGEPDLAAASEPVSAAEAARVAEAENSVPAESRAAAKGAEPGAIAAAAAEAERALVDERRHQRVRALGSICAAPRRSRSSRSPGSSCSATSASTWRRCSPARAWSASRSASARRTWSATTCPASSCWSRTSTGSGDVITVGDATGTVENVTLRITRLRDVNGIVWHIRNGAIEQVGNESQGWARAVVDFPVPYAADLATIRTLLAGCRGDRSWNDPAWRAVMLEKPEVWGAQEVSSSEVTMRIVVKTAPLRQWEVEREMRARVKAALDAAGICPVAAEPGSDRAGR